MHKKAINLGKLIVDEFGRGPGVDFLSRWMAHYIAEQIEIAEMTSGIAKAKAEAKCFKTILTLWKHRRHFPNGRRPFENFEPVLRALEALDPENNRPYYFHASKEQAEKQKNKEQKLVAKLIDIVFLIDETARILIEELLIEATALSVNKETKALLKADLPNPSEKDIAAIRALFEKTMSGNAEKEDKQQSYRRTIEDRLKKLETFSTCGEIVKKILKKRLKQ